MHKNLLIVLLIVVLAVTANHSARGTTDGPITSPVIVKKLVVRNHSGPIQQTTLFTPSQTGLFRISIYMTEITPGNTPANPWMLSLSWSDDAGSECCATVLGLSTVGTPPFAYAYFSPVVGSANPPTGMVVIEAAAGQPVAYSVDNGAPGTTGTYSIYAVVERMM